MKLFSRNSETKYRFCQGLLLLWQFISVYLMVIGEWPVEFAWVNLALIVGYIVVAPAFEGLLLATASMAFYTILPQDFSDTLSMWRVVAAVLFLKAFLLSLRGGDYATTKQSVLSLVAKYRLLRPSQSVASHNDRNSFRVIWDNLLSYEKIAVALGALAVVSLLLARYPIEGAKQLLFLLNALLIYFVVIWTVKNRDQFVRLLKYGVLSTGIIIGIGYIQFGITLFTLAYYFWQYWALRVASLFYGLPIAEVLQYSNSWVTVQGEAKILRMFSIMTSSHAFAMVCVFFLVFALPLLFLTLRKKQKRDANTVAYVKGRLVPEKVGKHAHGWLWFSIVLACLALILSGTRGVWAGMIPAFVLACFLYYRTKFRSLVAPVFAAMLLVVILFEASPLLDQGLAWVRNGGWRSGTLERVFSIVDTGETSNAGRLDMWKAASKQALQHPLGVGYGNFVVTLAGSENQNFEEVSNIDNEQYRLPQRYITAHNLYLQLLVELSVAGLSLFGLFWLFFFKSALRYIQERREGNVLGSVYITTLSIVCVWFLAYGVFDLTWLNDKILLYTFIALGLARVILTNRLDIKDNE